MQDVINELNDKADAAHELEAEKEAVYRQAADILTAHEAKAIAKRRAKNKRAKQSRKINHK